MPGWARGVPGPGAAGEGARQAGSAAVPAPPCSPVGHLGELRPLEIGRQPPDLIPGRRHRAGTRQPRAAGGGQGAGPASARSAPPRHGGAPARARSLETKGTKAHHGQGNKKRFAQSGLAPAAGSRRSGHGSSSPGLPAVGPGLS